MRWWLALSGAVTLHLMIGGWCIWRWQIDQAGIITAPVVPVMLVSLAHHALNAPPSRQQQGRFLREKDALRQPVVVKSQDGVMKKSRHSAAKLQREVKGHVMRASHSAALWPNHGVQKNSITMTSISGRLRNRLLIRIHNAAMRNLHVPPQAVWLNQHGSVQLQFVLLPSGQTTKVDVIQSSGFRLLDAAAKQSLQTLPIVSPLTLNQPLQLSLRIQFQ